MRIDSISLSEGSSISNLTVASGTTFSLTPDMGEMFFKTTDDKLYVYNGTAWLAISTGASGVSSVAGKTGVVTLVPSDIIGLPTITGSNTGDQTITLTGDVTGSGTGSFTTTLATVNGTPQTDMFRRITVNSKGLVTATSAVGSADITGALGFTPYNATNPAGYTNNTGTVTSIGVTTANGISGTSSGTATPSLTLTLGAITPSSVSTTGDVTVGGNLTVNGTTTTINATTLNVADLNVTIGSGATTSALANGAGLTVGNFASNPTLLYGNALDNFTFNRRVDATSFYGPLVGNVTGNVSGTAATITGVYAGTITSGQVTTGLGFTPYNVTNPAGYTANLGTVTQVTATAPVQSSGGTAPVISMPNASATVSGYLTATDWATFNAKSNTSGTVTSVSALTLTSTGTDVSSAVATSTTTPAITLNIPSASATARGLLTSTDWTTFNSKQPAGAYLTTAVSSVSVVTANGISGTVATATTTPAITLSLGAITPTSVTATAAISGTTLTSTVASGTAPLTVTSNTLVTNLNADLHDGMQATSANTASSIVARDASGNFSANTVSSTYFNTPVTSPASGYGFWASVPVTYGILMSASTDTTYGGRISGESTSDFNMYFTMANATNRGFVFRTAYASPLFAINPDGVRSNVGVTITGALQATTKSFLINHPTKSGKKLRYGSLEGPENGVYVRGRTKMDTIQLPEYWSKLVDPDSITVELTPIGKHQKLYVISADNDEVVIGNENMFGGIDCYYTVYGERADVDKLIVEF